MVICLLYIGIIVVLHIFGKVKSQGSAPNIPTMEDIEFAENIENVETGN